MFFIANITYVKMAIIITVWQLYIESGHFFIFLYIDKKKIPRETIKCILWHNNCTFGINELHPGKCKVKCYSLI